MATDFSQAGRLLANPARAIVADATALLDRQWICRAGSGRGLTVTEAGVQGLHASLGIDVGEMSASGSAPAPPC
jgi:hypothetical protein